MISRMNLKMSKLQRERIRGVKIDSSFILGMNAVKNRVAIMLKFTQYVTMKVTLRVFILAYYLSFSAGD